MAITEFQAAYKAYQEANAKDLARIYLEYTASYCERDAADYAYAAANADRTSLDALEQIEAQYMASIKKTSVAHEAYVDAAEAVHIGAMAAGEAAIRSH